MNHMRNSSLVNVQDCGASPDASAADNRTAFQRAINKCLENLRTLYVPAGEYLLKPGLEVMVDKDSNYKSAFTMIGDPCEAQRNTSMPSHIIFEDNASNGSTGLSSTWQDDLVDKVPVGFKLQYLQFSTQSLGEESSSVDFMGLHIPGGSLDIRDCLFMGFTGCALQVFDLGYAHVENTVFRGNSVGLRHTLQKWQAGTTTTFRRCMGFSNGIVFHVPHLNHSAWEYYIFEQNDYGVKDFDRNCVFYKNYAEANRRKAAEPRNDKFSTALLISNYSHRRLPENLFSCKKGVYLSTAEVPVEAEAVVTSLVSDNSGKAEGKIIGFTVHNNVIQNNTGSIPNGWHFEHESTGTYRLDFSQSVRPLHFHVQAVDPDGNVINHFTAFVVGLGPQYPKFGTASGIRIETFEILGLRGVAAEQELTPRFVQRDSDLVITIIAPVDW